MRPRPLAAQHHPREFGCHASENSLFERFLEALVGGLEEISLSL
jgi:hypothetical protein